MKKKFKGRKVQTERQAWLMAVFRRSHAIEELPDTIVEAVQCTEMDKRHNGLNKLLLVIPGERELRSREGRGPRS